MRPYLYYGTVKVHVKYEGQREVLSVLVVDGKGPNLMGRDWLAKVKVMPQIHSLSDHTPLKEVLSQHATVLESVVTLRSLSTKSYEWSHTLYLGLRSYLQTS